MAEEVENWVSGLPGLSLVRPSKKEPNQTRLWTQKVPSVVQGEERWKVYLLV